MQNNSSLDFPYFYRKSPAMCYAVYIGTEKKLESRKFVEGETYLYFEKAGEDDADIIKKFSKPNVFFVGSYQGCSCGFTYDTEIWDPADPETAQHKRSVGELIDFLKEATQTEDIEYYCCQTGDSYLPIEQTRDIDIQSISIDENYFDLTEREFILFRN